MPTINMMKADKMTMATLMTMIILAPMLRLGKRMLVTTAVNTTWVLKLLMEIHFRDLLESAVFEISHCYNCDVDADTIKPKIVKVIREL